MSQRGIYYYFYYWDYCSFSLLEKQLRPFILCFGGHIKGLSVFQMS